MNNQDHTQRDRQARDIFLRAVEIQSPEARSGYIEGACQHDDSLRSRVEALLKSHKQDSFLETSAVNGAPTFISETPISEGPGAVIDRYKLLQKLGEGGFGIVYMAEQKTPVKRRVALKIIKLGMDTKQVVARFEAERQALAMMDHPNIAKVFDAGATDTGRPYFVMELVKGVPITKYCDDNQLTTKERLDLFIAVCQAIQHAHQKGIIHRDIKPSNIMITLHDGVPVPKVIDFGIAKATQQELTERTIFTQYSQFIGTPAYMSPEQAEMSGLDIDTRSDIYSLGVVLYELLVGRTPLDAKELMSGGYEEIRRRIKEEEPSKPSTKASTFEGAEKTTVAKHRKISPGQLSSELRGDLDWIVLKALEKDRTRRYETANGFALDLKRYLANEPVTAVAPRPAYLLKKYARRHRAALAVAAAIAGLLMVGTTVSTWQAIRATQARRVAQAERDKAQTAQQAAQQARLRADEEKANAQHLLYVANMNLVQQAWEQNNVERARQLLDETAISPERGFEWYYWQRQMHLEIQTLHGQGAEIDSVAFSPDGRRLVTGSKYTAAKVWDLATGRPLFTLGDRNGSSQSVRFSPDGRRILTGGWDFKARIWDALTEKELLVFTAPDNNKVWSVAFSPDGKRIVTCSEDKTATVWNATNGNELFSLTGHDGTVWSAAFSPDGEQILTGSEDKTARLWDARSGKLLLTLEGHRGDIKAVAFSPNGQRIVTGSWDKTAKVWEAASGKELLTLKGHSGEVWSAAFSPDSERIVTGSLDQTAKVWDATTGTELFALRGHSAVVRAVAFSPDGQRIATGSGDSSNPRAQTAKIWDASGSREVLILKGHSNGVSSAVFSPDGHRIVTGSWDQTARVWDPISANVLITLTGHSNGISSVRFSPDGQRIVTASYDQTAKVWDAASGQEFLTLKEHGSALESAAYSPDGKRIVTAGDDNTAKVWDAASGRKMVTLSGHTKLVFSAVFSPDGQRIVTGSWDQTARVWDSTSGRELFPLNGHSFLIAAAAFSPDGDWIVTGSSDRTAKVWDAATGQERRTLRGHSEQIWSVAFSPDGRRLVTGGKDATAKVWDLITGKELLTLRGHNEGVRSVAFSPDGRRIVTGSYDHTAKVWEGASAAQVEAWQKEEQAAAGSR